MKWDMDLDGEKLAAKLYEAIVKSGMSYGELAEKTGIHKSVIQRYATGGIKKIPLTKMIQLAKALKTDFFDLVGWEKPQVTEVLNLDENELLTYYRKAEPVYQQVAKDILKEHPCK